ncbi:unnamed protein product [Arctogadus glacialis]
MWWTGSEPSLYSYQALSVPGNILGRFPWRSTQGFMRYLVISQALVPECLNVFISIVFTLRPASQHIPDLQSYVVQRWPCGTPRPPHHSASIMEQGGSRSTRPPQGSRPPSFTPTFIPTLTSIAHDIPRYAEAASGYLTAPAQTTPFHTSIQCTLKSHNSNKLLSVPHNAPTPVSLLCWIPTSLGTEV